MQAIGQAQSEFTWSAKTRTRLETRSEKGKCPSEKRSEGLIGYPAAVRRLQWANITTGRQVAYALASVLGFKIPCAHLARRCSSAPTWLHPSRAFLFRVLDCRPPTWASRATCVLVGTLWFRLAGKRPMLAPRRSPRAERWKSYSLECF